MPIYQVGQLNTTALSAPGVYLQIQPPPMIINGVPSNVLGAVGVGSWGPVNAPTLCGGPSDVTRYLGAAQVRKYDLATAFGIWWLLGATAVQYVRVTDGTDTAAAGTLMDTAGTPAIGAHLTGFYTGSLGNNIGAAITTGTKQSTYKLTITMPNLQPEVFDNIPGTGATFWTNLVNAVNNGIGTRGPSQLVIATIGVSTATPNTSTTYALTGGADGTTGVVDSTLVGVDGIAGVRKGMYCLRGTGSQVGCLVDHSDITAASTVLALGLSEGIYFGAQGQPGQNYATVATALNTAGADGYGLKVFVGDWITYQDNTNNQQRLLGPTTFWAGLQASLSPEKSSLNKPIAGIVTTQRVAQNQPYTSGEIGFVKTSRLDCISNPCPGGAYYGCETGVNASSNAATLGDNYTRMTNYIALTLANAFGSVIGENQTTDLRTDAQTAMQAFLMNLWKAKMIGDVNNPTKVPFTVDISSDDNTDSQVAAGYMTANVAVKYLSVVFYFVINLQGGQTVVIQSSVQQS
ncbi:phage tail protein [Paraburkholderia phosphatilytica]|uniref:phage tail protein n=1 Tax=Paraburkholderia phosphatilytica TaxID=2282883 RepID=UPI000E4FE501|nr:phage tail protein [Paraburkholderia phosphatilytica]